MRPVHFSVSVLPLLTALGLFSAAVPAQPATKIDVPCGGNFKGFIAGLKAEAIARGHDRASVDRFFRSVAFDPKTIRADNAQGVFRLTFTNFARRVISQYRLTNGRKYAKADAALLARVKARYGVPPGVMLALWALETDFGKVQGNFNTLNSLVTLAHDCRRPEMFRPQIFAALSLYESGNFDPRTTRGAWAGEIGMVQMLPKDILERGVDGDGDGHVRLRTSVADALMSGGRMLSEFGWRAGQPWLVEVRVSKRFDWALSGLERTLPVSQWARLGVRARTGTLPGHALAASLLLPQGRKGPAFLAYPNFNVYFEWNKSFTYVTAAAYFATRLAGAPVFAPGTPDPQLTGAQIKALQRKLAARGHDVGKIDGILGEKTRAAVQAEQIRLGLPADAWPTRALLGRR